MKRSKTNNRQQVPAIAFIYLAMVGAMAFISAGFAVAW
jgi:hypothetical protein